MSNAPGAEAEEADRLNRFPFLAGGGELAARIAEYDWASTSIGRLDAWPACLRHTVGLMLRSDVPLVLLWGEDGVMIYNDAYSEFAGGRDSRLLGSNVREGWEEVADFNDNVMKVGLAGGTLKYTDFPLTLYRNGEAEQVWLNLDYSPVLDDQGIPAGVLAVVVEVTTDYNARQVMEENERRLAFLDGMSQAIGASRDADEILSIATRLTAEHLAVSNCAYADMDPADDGFTVRGDWHASDVPSILGHYSLAGFGTLAVSELGAGRPLIVNDNLAELPPEEAESFRDIGVAATICMPLIKEGRLTALMAIHHKAPREWSRYDLTIIREVTDRSWAHIERVRTQEQLEAREAQLRRSQEAGGVGLFSIDSGTNQISATPQFCRIFGIPVRETIPATEIEGLIVPEDAHLVSKGRSRREGTAPLDVVYRIRRADTGEERVVARRSEYERNAAGQVVCMVGALTDITERRRIQLALERSEAGFAALAQYMPNQVWTSRSDGYIDWFNSRVHHYCGVPEGSLDGDAWSRLIHPDDLASVTSRWAAALQSGETYETEFRMRSDSGEYRWFLARALPLRDSQGQVISWVGTNTDIHDQKMLAAASTRDRERLWSMSQDILLVCDYEGTITEINPSAERVLGWAEGEMVGKNLADFVHPDDAFATSDEVARLSSGARPSRSRTAIAPKMAITACSTGPQCRTKAASTASGATSPINVPPKMRCARARKWKRWVS